MEQIRELKQDGNVSYVLENNKLFYDIGFKVMKNQENKSLIPCHRLKYNGKIKLVYFTQNYIPLKKMLLETEHEEQILSNLAVAIDSLEHIGFLNMDGIERSLDKIYIDPDTYAVKMIYLPVSFSSGGMSRKELEQEIRTQMEALLGHAPELEAKQQRGISVESIDRKISFQIEAEEFYIGKSADKADGLITGNPAISRVHCRILHRGNDYYIEDMGSSNGTYVNGKRLEANETVPLLDGTAVKLANMDFIVRRMTK